MEIWVHRNGQYAGRFSESVIREKLADGSLSATDLAWDEAKAAWKPISEFLAALPAAKTDAAPSSLSSSAASAASQSTLEPSSGAAHRAAATEEQKPAAASRAIPPPLPSMPMPAAGPPPLPTMVPSPTPAAAQSSAHQPPEGETIWSPYMAIFGSILLTPAFGGFLIWRNWLRMNRRRRAMVAAPWFWLRVVVLALLFYSRDRIVWIVWAADLLAWVAFSAY